VAGLPELKRIVKMRKVTNIRKYDVECGKYEVDKEF
jgi:hypothetical protein